MENGHDGKLAEKLSGLALNDNKDSNNDDSLFQVMKAVEAAEATIKQQVLFFFFSFFFFSNNNNNKSNFVLAGGREQSIEVRTPEENRATRKLCRKIYHFLSSL